MPVLSACTWVTSFLLNYPAPRMTSFLFTSRVTNSSLYKHLCNAALTVTPWKKRYENWDMLFKYFKDWPLCINWSPSCDTEYEEQISAFNQMIWAVITKHQRPFCSQALSSSNFWVRWMISRSTWEAIELHPATVASLSRPPWPAKPARKMIWA